jgi:hypothetical protein
MSSHVTRGDFQRSAGELSRLSSGYEPSREDQIQTLSDTRHREAADQSSDALPRPVRQGGYSRRGDTHPGARRSKEI